MEQVMIPTRRSCSSRMTACQRRSRMRWKSTLENVTNSVANTESGNMLSQKGPSTDAAPDNWGTYAKPPASSSP